jgi:hypothetical protein
MNPAINVRTTVRDTHLLHRYHMRPDYPTRFGMRDWLGQTVLANAIQRIGFAGADPRANHNAP